MVRPISVLTLASILLIGPLSGCLSDTDRTESFLPFSFHLVYDRLVLDGKGSELEKNRISLTLDTIDRIHDTDGRLREAYRMEAEGLLAPGDHYLDHLYRQIRYDHHHCLFHQPGKVCEDITLMWHDRGVNPYGIGLPALLNTHEPTFWVRTGQPLVPPIESERTSEGDLLITVHDPGSDSFYRGNYWYAPGKIYPYSAEESYEDSRVVLQLVEAREGDTMPSITSHEPAPVHSEPLEYQIYPGEEIDFFGYEWTTRNAYERLLAESPHARGMLDGGGCVFETFHSFHGPEDQFPLDRLYWTYIFTIFGIVGPEQQYERWVVRWATHSLYPDMIHVYHNPDHDRKIDFNCNEVRGSHPMRVSMDDALSRVRPIIGECHERLTFSFLAHDQRIVAPDPDTVWGSLWINKQDEPCDDLKAPGSVHPIILSAHHGGFVQMRLTHQEYRAWEPSARDPADRF